MERIDHQSAKIIATVGPASSEYSDLLALARAGVDVFRLNFSHGTHEKHREVIERVAYINDKYSYHIGIICDLQGPKIRIGDIEGGSVSIEDGSLIRFVNEPCMGTAECVYLSYEGFSTDVHPGERVLVDDGQLILEVVEIVNSTTVLLKVIHGGTLSSKKGVNLPDTQISLPSLTEKDMTDLQFILTQPIHWSALSFVR